MTLGDLYLPVGLFLGIVTFVGGLTFTAYKSVVDEADGYSRSVDIEIDRVWWSTLIAVAVACMWPMLLAAGVVFGVVYGGYLLIRQVIKSMLVKDDEASDVW